MFAEDNRELMPIDPIVLCKCGKQMINIMASPPNLNVWRCDCGESMTEEVSPLVQMAQGLQDILKASGIDIEGMSPEK